MITNSSLAEDNGDNEVNGDAITLLLPPPIDNGLNTLIGVTLNDDNEDIGLNSSVVVERGESARDNDGGREGAGIRIGGGGRGGKFKFFSRDSNEILFNVVNSGNTSNFLSTSGTESAEGTDGIDTLSVRTGG